MRISDWSSDVCSSDLRAAVRSCPAPCRPASKEWPCLHCACHAGPGHKCAANGLRWRRHATMLARHQPKEVVMVRTVLVVVLGPIASILALDGAGPDGPGLPTLPARERRGVAGAKSGGEVVETGDHG